jgi:DNA-binding NarL/FixJ family response regulator
VTPEPATAPVAVLVADDHELYRRGMRVVLSLDPDIEVVGDADGGRAAIDRAAELAPDVVLMDVRMPDLGGIDACRVITSQGGAPQVVMLSMSDDEGDLYDAMIAGAIGYVLKDRPAEVIAAAVHDAHAGRPILTAGVAARALDALRRLDPPPTGPEDRLLTQVSRGRSLEDAAKELGQGLEESALLLRGALARLQMVSRS